MAWNDEVNKTYGDLTNFDATAKSAIDIYNETMAKYGVADARTRVSDFRTALTNTENQLRGVSNDVQGRTQEQNLSENQRRRIVQMDSAPIEEALRVNNQNYSNANSDYQGLLGETKQEADLNYQQQSDKRKALQDRLSYAQQMAREEEQKRQYEQEFAYKKQQDALAAAAAAKSSKSGGGGGGGGSKAASGGGYTATKDGSGGYQFKNAKGKPVSMREYAENTGTNVITVLRGINTAGAKQAAADFYIMTPAAFAKKYPYIMG